MDFLLFSASKKLNYKTIKERLQSLDYYKVEAKDSGVFHVSEVDENTIHIIFYINDEFRTHSKYISEINATPLQVYINAFMFVDEGKLFIQNLELGYCNEILEIIKRYIDIEFIKSGFQVNNIKNIIKSKAQDISKCEFEHEEIIIKTTENKLDTISFLKNTDEYDNIYYVCFTYQALNKILITVSLTNTGKLNIKSNIPNLIIKTLKVLISNNDE